MLCTGTLIKGCANCNAIPPTLTCKLSALNVQTAVRKQEDCGVHVHKSQLTTECKHSRWWRGSSSKGRKPPPVLKLSLKAALPSLCYQWCWVPQVLICSYKERVKKKMLALWYTAGSSVLFRVCSGSCQAAAVSSEPASSGSSSATASRDHRLTGRKGFAVLPPPQPLLRPEAGQTQCFTKQVDVLVVGVKQGSYPHCPEEWATSYSVSGLLRLWNARWKIRVLQIGFC